MESRIYMIGYMGAGKTTIGRRLASMVRYPFIDLDQYIETAHGTSVTDIFLDRGEEYFRVLEQRYLKKVTHLQQAVIACGGGTPCFYDNLEVMLKSGLVIYLKQSINVLHQRLIHQQMQRPLLMGMDESQLAAFINQNVTRREQFYLQAHLIFEPEKETFEQLVDRLSLFNKGG